MSSRVTKLNNATTQTICITIMKRPIYTGDFCGDLSGDFMANLWQFVATKWSLFQHCSTLDAICRRFFRWRVTKTYFDVHPSLRVSLSHHAFKKVLKKER